MRTWAALGLLALGLTGCARCESKVELESFVTVPTDLDAVEKLDDPPDVRVKIEKQAVPKGGGGGCGHSAVCIIIIPFVIADSLFPEKLRIATVTEKGRETYHGVFRENGQFVQALAFQDGVWKKVALLQLAELGRNLAVEVARAKPDAKGDPGEFERSSLQKQVDVLSGYRALLVSSADAERRGRLVREMLTHAHVDALPLAKERLVDAKESATVKLAALEAICGEKPPIGSAEQRAALMKDLDASSPDVETSAAALRCFDPKRPQSASAFTARLVDAACAAKDASEAAELVDKVSTWGVGALKDEGWKAGGRGVRGSVEPFVSRCAARERRLLLRFALGFELERTELSELVASSDPATARTVISRMDNGDATHRAVLLEELERPQARVASIILVLARGGRDPDAAEAKALAGAYLAQESHPDARAEVLIRFEAIPDALRQPARDRIDARLRAAAGVERAALHAALVTLGDSEHEAGAARALQGRCLELARARAGAPGSSASPSGSTSAPPPDAAGLARSEAGAAAPSAPSALDAAESRCALELPANYANAKDTVSLIAVVLQRAGCTQREVFEVAAHEPDPKSPERGRVCREESR